MINIKAIVHSSMMNKRKLSHILSKGLPISVAVVHSRVKSYVKSDVNTEESAISLNNSVNISILKDLPNVGTYLN